MLFETEKPCSQLWEGSAKGPVVLMLWTQVLCRQQHQSLVPQELSNADETLENVHCRHYSVSSINFAHAFLALIPF